MVESEVDMDKTRAEMETGETESSPEVDIQTEAKPAEPEPDRTAEIAQQNGQDQSQLEKDKANLDQAVKEGQQLDIAEIRKNIEVTGFDEETTEQIYQTLEKSQQTLAEMGIDLKLSQTVSRVEAKKVLEKAGQAYQIEGKKDQFSLASCDIKNGQAVVGLHQEGLEQAGLDFQYAFVHELGHSLEAKVSKAQIEQYFGDRSDRAKEAGAQVTDTEYVKNLKEKSLKDQETIIAETFAEDFEQLMSNKPMDPKQKELLIATLIKAATQNETQETESIYTDTFNHSELDRNTSPSSKKPRQQGQSWLRRLFGG